MWGEAAAAITKETGINLRTHVIGPRQTYVDHVGDWVRTSEISDTGAILVRPDHHVAWRSDEMVDDPEGTLCGVFDKILARI